MADQKVVFDCGDQTVETVELTADEQAQRDTDLAAAAEGQWAELRAARNSLLSESDWTQVQDATANPDDWTAYRQELRDLPANTADPFAPVWPEPPLTPGERSAAEH